MMPVRRSNWLPSIFNDFFGNEWVERSHAASPAVNIRETDNEYKVEVAAAGLTKDDFKIHLKDGNQLVVSMEKSSENKDENKEGRYIRREFSYSSFRQSMILPEDVEIDRIGARVENGVLHISIPKKKEEPKAEISKQIEIK